jgi:polyhydroxyalkanoate synthesis regulator phasin
LGLIQKKEYFKELKELDDNLEKEFCSPDKNMSENITQFTEDANTIFQRIIQRKDGRIQRLEDRLKEYREIIEQLRSQINALKLVLVAN